MARREEVVRLPGDDKALKPERHNKPAPCAVCGRYAPAIIHMSRARRRQYGYTDKGHAYTRPGGAIH